MVLSQLIQFMSRARPWCFTLNNYQEDDPARLLAMVPEFFRFLCFGIETGDSGTPHLQGYAYSRNPVGLSYCRERILLAHWEISKGRPDQAIGYCEKDGDFHESTHDVRVMVMVLMVEETGWGWMSRGRKRRRKAEACLQPSPSLPLPCFRNNNHSHRNNPCWVGTSERGRRSEMRETEDTLRGKPSPSLPSSPSRSAYSLDPQQSPL